MIIFWWWTFDIEPACVVFVQELPKCLRTFLRYEDFGSFPLHNPGYVAAIVLLSASFTSRSTSLAEPLPSAPPHEHTYWFYSFWSFWTWEEFLRFCLDVVFASVWHLLTTDYLLLFFHRSLYPFREDNPIISILPNGWMCHLCDKFCQGSRISKVYKHLCSKTHKMRLLIRIAQFGAGRTSN